MTPEITNFKYVSLWIYLYFLKFIGEMYFCRYGIVAQRGRFTRFSFPLNTLLCIVLWNSKQNARRCFKRKKVHWAILPTKFWLKRDVSSICQKAQSVHSWRLRDKWRARETVAFTYLTAVEKKQTYTNPSMRKWAWATVGRLGAGDFCPIEADCLLSPGVHRQGLSLLAFGCHRQTYWHSKAVLLVFYFPLYFCPAEGHWLFQPMDQPFSCCVSY